jgi:hypothetical protein
MKRIDQHPANGIGCRFQVPVQVSGHSAQLVRRF